MNFKIATAPHVVHGPPVARIMRQVIYALIPGTLAMSWFFGPGVLINIAIASAAALVSEAAMLKLRRRDPLVPLSDGSAVVCAWLLALALPPLAPWWLPAVGAVFAIVIAKQLFGGIGYNIFNPAMAGYCALIVSFPVEMTRWLPPRGLPAESMGFLETLFFSFNGQLPAGFSWDAITQATPLDRMTTELSMMHTMEEIRASPLWGSLGGRGWEWAANGYLLGGLWLAYRRIIDWRIPTAVIGSLLAMASAYYFADPDTHPFPAFHLFSGGAMLGAFFIATDPVSASTTPLGRWIYGAGIGVLIFILRSFGAYPDGVAFAVLLMNAAVPLIDRYTVPRPFGHRRGKRA